MPATLIRTNLWLAAALALPAAAAGQPAMPAFPEDHRTLTRTVSYAEMEAFLRSVDGVGPVRVAVEGRTAGGRSIYVVRLSHGGEAAWRVLLFAQQHGDEVSGKDALLYLVRDLAGHPERLPADVELWVMPMLNPDGAEAGTRRNGAGADLNRDHMVLEQPETQALYRVVRRVRPHVAVDCHEFTRDSAARRERGWLAWPDITMDGLNNPLFDRAVVTAAQRWVDEAAAVEAAAGHAYLRYSVGGLPPDDEQRPSAPDVDGGLNGVGAYGGLSFIIEAAVRRAVADPAADLGARVDAYLVLFRRFLAGGSRRTEDLAAVVRSRARALPKFLPTNYFWASPGIVVTEFPVLEAATGRRLDVPTANKMTEMVVKATVPTPAAYAIEAGATATFRVLLERHGIPYEELAAPRAATVESCALVRVEDEFDELYNRYEGRTVVRRGPATARELPAGWLWVPLEGEAALRAALVLEPAMLYGLYQYPDYRALVGADGALPVLRVVR